MRVIIYSKMIASSINQILNFREQEGRSQNDTSKIWNSRNKIPRGFTYTITVFTIFWKSNLNQNLILRRKNLLHSL